MVGSPANARGHLRRSMPCRPASAQAQRRRGRERARGRASDVAGHGGASARRDLRRGSAVKRWSDRRPAGCAASAPLVTSLVAVLTVESCLADRSRRSFPAVICGSMRTELRGLHPPESRTGAIEWSELGPWRRSELGPCFSADQGFPQGKYWVSDPGNRGRSPSGTSASGGG